MKFKKKVSLKILILKIYTKMKNKKPAATQPAHKTPPENLYNNFTQNGEMPITQIYYFAQKYSTSLSQWTVLSIKKRQKNIIHISKLVVFVFTKKNSQIKQ